MARRNVLKGDDDDRSLRDQTSVRFDVEVIYVGNCMRSQWSIRLIKTSELYLEDLRDSGINVRF